MELLEIDELQLYFGDPYIINDKLTIFQPKINDIVDFGEGKYFNMLHYLTAIPSDMKAQLFDMGLDYEHVSDFELFLMLAPTLPQNLTYPLLGDVDLSQLKMYRNIDNDQIYLGNKETGLKIDIIIYERMVNYLRKLHGLKKKVERAVNARTKQVLIEEDRNRIVTNKNKPYKSFLLPLISSIKARQGYTLDYVRNMGLYEFMDEVSRLQIIHNADALLHGAYSGMIDTKKIKKSEFNWMKEMEH